ncbi:hypothetical protein [Aliamphritea spongicola]|nr:hypothetical protein [Aliamphritea spongicola]
MDVQRVLLIAALGIISYMLVLQWNQDYSQPPATVAQAETVSAYDSTAPVSELPQETASGSDVPGVTPATAAAKRAS